MKFAFSTLSCPGWDFATVAARAKEYGFAGVEIRAFCGEAAKTSADVMKEPAGAAGAVFKDAGVEIACVASVIGMTRDGRKNAESAEHLKRLIDRAAELGCPLVKARDGVLLPGQSHARSAAATGEWLAPLGEYAAQRNVTIVVENAMAFRRSRDLWMVLEGAGQPSVAAAWNVLYAAVAGEGPAVSVPTLNSRIAYVTIKDAKILAKGVSYCKLGEGELALSQLLNKLKGVGYKGFVSFEWDKALVGALAEPEDVLPAAIAKLKEWTKPQVEPKPAKKEVVKKDVVKKEAAPA